MERVSTLRALLSVLKMPNEQDRTCSRSRTVSSRYECSRCHVLFSSCSPVSRDRVHRTSLSLSCFKEKKKLAPKTLIHTQACWLQARNNSQKRPSCTCARGQGHTSNESEKSLQHVVDMPSPFSPNTPRRVLSCHRTEWSVLASSTAAVQRKHYNNQP